MAIDLLIGILRTCKGVPLVDGPVDLSQPGNPKP